jgi:lysophospholipase L1-like esterase
MVNFQGEYMRRLNAVLMFTMAVMTLQLHAAKVRFILVGDSTVAEKSGWGPAFCHDVVAEVTCINMARGGRSTKSYREDGTWAKVIEKLKSKGDFSKTYVLIQFGHNDQPGKPGRSTDLATEFPANMTTYVNEVKAAGGLPVIVTPLSRRTWGADGKIADGLGPWADADKRVASTTNTPLVDLHSDSIAALNRMGQTEGDTLAMAPRPDPNAPAPTMSTERNGEAVAKFDGTHLGPKGAMVFARIVENDLAVILPETKSYFISR